MKKTFPVYLITFLFSFAGALSLYVNSSFLGQFLGETAIGFVFAATSIIVIALFAILPRILARFGNFKTMTGAIILQTLSLIALALPISPTMLILAFLLTQICTALIWFNFDIFLERFSIDTKTGTTRGVFLTIANFAILLGPLTTGYILLDGDFYKIYLLSAVILLPILLLSVLFLKTFKDPAYHIVPYMRIVKNIALARHPNDEIRHATIASLLLRFFYSWMVIYTPLYLYKYIGFTWSEIGMILTVMLVPFVLFEIPMGRLADTKIGEKKIMMFGFLIMSTATASLFVVTEKSIVVWALLLFTTRIGASFVEIATESYFFKHITSVDTEVLSVFRNSQVFAGVVGPLLASVVIFIADIQYPFLFTGIIMLYGIVVSYNMKNHAVRTSAVRASNQ